MNENDGVMTSGETTAGRDGTWSESPRGAAWLIQIVSPRLLVDVANPFGAYYRELCRAVQRQGLATQCYAVTGIDADVRTQSIDSNGSEAEFASFSHAIRGDFVSAVDAFPDGSVDLLLLPVPEMSDSLAELLSIWRTKLSASGVVVVHGLAVSALHDAELVRMTEVYASLALASDAVLLAVGPSMPSALAAVFEDENSNRNEIEVALDSTHVPDIEQDGSGRDIGELVQRLEEQAVELDRVRRALAEAEARLNEADSRSAERERDVRSLTTALDIASVSSRVTMQKLQYFQIEVAALKRSHSWTITAPLRASFTVARRCRHLLKQVRFLTGVLRRKIATEGIAVTSRKVIQAAADPFDILQRVFGKPSGELRPVYPLGTALPAPERLRQRVLLIAELSLPQCLKYRVMQKRLMIESLGVECTIVNWSDVAAARSLLQTHTVAIFYRVPGYPSILKTIEVARSLGVPSYWEVDDLIFDLEHYRNNSNLENIDKKTRHAILKGVPLYREAMLACDGAIASTQPLAEAMLAAGAKSVHVIENALDIDTSRIAEQINSGPVREDGLVRIVYGSGSAAHDSDFRVAAPAILKVLKARFHVRLTIIGSLKLPPEFKEMESQVERLPPSDYETYLKRLSRCHVNIAPLEPTIFNDAKSNIKYLEAATLHIPSVCSPTAEYLTTIQQGETGFLASTVDEWEAMLTQLVDDAALRKAMGDRAYAHVQAHYTPSIVATEQVEPLLAPHRRFSPKPLRILGVNIFFEPRSFGGATIVAEQVARRINTFPDAEYAVVTSLPVTDVDAYKLVRYQSSSAEVFALGLPPEGDPSLDFDNPYPVGSFRQVLRAWRPDVVHIHSIQGIGVQVAEACKLEGIPFTVTLHDAWWICARQFMVTGEGKYCYQRKIDINICASCVPRPTLNPYRQHRLREVLSEAALLMSPSTFFRGIYVDNGFDPGRLVVNKNGIVKPKRSPSRTPPSQRPLRFGFVGGEGPIKGGDLIKKALRGLPQFTNYELCVVDNELNLGRRSIFESAWAVPGTLKIVPAYTQETIDDFFGSIDILLFPTQWKESFGLSVREALIRDCWVIATDAGGVVEDIVPGENGDVISLKDDGTELQKAIEVLLANPGRLDGYRNPHAGLICLFEDQTAELHDYMAMVAEKYPRSTEILPALEPDDLVDNRFS